MWVPIGKHGGGLRLTSRSVLQKAQNQSHLSEFIQGSYKKSFRHYLVSRFDPVILPGPATLTPLSAHASK